MIISERGYEMERGKYPKKTSLCFILSMMLIAVLAGCGGKRKIKINGSYNEWIDAMGIDKYPHTDCVGYKEYDNGVELRIKEFNYATADEFKKILDNHNAFVKRNPDYFPEDFDIDLIFECCGGDIKLRFSNYADVENVDVSLIEEENSYCMRYVYPYKYGYDDRINTKFEAETIITSAGKHINEIEKAHDWSEYFENFDTIVVECTSEEMNIEDALKKIQEANPDAEIYYKTYSKELTKYVPDENEN